MKGLGRVALGFVLIAAVGGCSGDSSSAPSGPGSVAAQISAPVPLSAAVIDIVGAGITGARAVGSDQVVGTPTGGTPSTGYRVVVFPDAAGTIRLSLDVDDVGSSFTASVVSAADADGELVSGVGGLTVTLSR